MRPHSCSCILTCLGAVLIASAVCGQDTIPPALPDSARTTAFDTLSGVLPQSVKKKDRPYLVATDIEVAPGATVLIEPGTVFLFRNFTTMHVHGTVLARATKDLPIVFTSENDSAFNRGFALAPAAYDWNGITVYENGNGSSFRNCSIRYSLYGINSLTKLITVEDCIFLQNGKSDLTIEGKKYETVSRDFFYGAGDQDTAQQASRIFGASTSLSGRQAPSAARNRHAGRLALRWSGVSLFGAGAVLLAWQATEYSAAKANFDERNDTNNPENNVNTILELRADAKAKVDNAVLGIITGAAIAICGAAGCGISFVF